jgi:hypothetical protein
VSAAATTRREERRAADAGGRWRSAEPAAHWGAQRSAGRTLPTAPCAMRTTRSRPGERGGQARREERRAADARRRSRTARHRRCSAQCAAGCGRPITCSCDPHGHARAGALGRARRPCTLEEQRGRGRWRAGAAPNGTRRRGLPATRRPVLRRPRLANCAREYTRGRARQPCTRESTGPRALEGLARRRTAGAAEAHATRDSRRRPRRANCACESDPRGRARAGAGHARQEEASGRGWADAAPASTPLPVRRRPPAGHCYLLMRHMRARSGGRCGPVRQEITLGRGRRRGCGDDQRHALQVRPSAPVGQLHLRMPRARTSGAHARRRERRAGDAGRGCTVPLAQPFTMSAERGSAVKWTTPVPPD